LRISVVIPTKNRAEVLKRSLASAVNQTVPVDEIIVVDNNSTDNTKEVVEAFNDRRIIYFRSDVDVPITYNWILGIKAARGEWVKVIYDDDWVEDNFVEAVLPYMQPDKVMVHTGGTTHFHDTSVLCCPDSVDSSRPVYELLKQNLLQVNPVGAIIRKSALEYAIEVMPRLDHVCIDEGIGPDVILLYAATTQIPNSWTHVPELLAHYEGRCGSLSVKTVKERPGFLEDCYKKSFELLEDLHTESLIRA
jgi:glycosyltransferase involved in cell wall biosynthesis